MIRYTKNVVTHPWLYILAILLITTFFTYNLKNIHSDPDITSSLPKNIPSKLLYDRMNKIFPSRDFILIAVESKQLFSPSTIATIYKLTNELENVPDVYSVMSPTNIKVIRGSAEGMEVQSILKAPPASLADVDAYRYTLYHSDLPIENIISKDGTMAGIMVFLKNTVKPEDAAAEVMRFTEKIKTNAHIYITGKPILSLYLGRGMGRDMGLLFPLVLLLIIIILLLSFRNARGVLLPLSVVLISVLWTIGLMAFLGIPISHSTNMLPILLASIAVADGIHILNRYFNHLERGRSSTETITIVMKELNAPVIITSVTTAFGFLALNVSNIGSVGELGIFTATGVIFAMFFSLTFIPAVLALLPVPKRMLAQSGSCRMNRLAANYAAFVVNQKNILVFIVLAIIIFSVFLL